MITPEQHLPFLPLFVVPANDNVPLQMTLLGTYHVVHARGSSSSQWTSRMGRAKRIKAVCGSP